MNNLLLACSLTASITGAVLPPDAVSQSSIKPEYSLILNGFTLQETLVLDNSTSTQKRARIFKYNKELSVVSKLLSDKTYYTNNGTILYSKNIEQSTTSTVEMSITASLNYETSTTIEAEIGLSGFVSLSPSTQLSTQYGLTTGYVSTTSHTHTYGETITWTQDTISGYYYCLEERVHVGLYAMCIYDYISNSWCVENNDYYFVKVLGAPYISISTYAYASNGRYTFVSGSNDNNSLIYVSSSDYIIQ